MAKKQAQTTEQGTRRPVDDQAIRARGGVPFLRAEHIGLRGREWFELTGLNVMKHRDTDNEQVNCEIRNQRGELFQIGIRWGSPDHRRMHHAFGSEWRRWSGAVLMAAARGDRPGQIFVNVAECADTPQWNVSQEREPGSEG